MNDGCKSRWPEPEPQSALVIVVPDAEFLVEVVRSAHDPAAAAGIPPHITVLYPFLPPKQLSAAGIQQEVASCFQQFVPFDFVLVSVKRFPGTLYVAPEPSELFRALTLRVWETFPGCPPYKGRHSHIIPHLTVASNAGEEILTRVAGEFEISARQFLPLPARAEEVALLTNEFGPWQAVATFPLGRGGACSEAEVRPFSERLRGEL